MSTLHEDVEKAIATIRPFLNADGGDMELVEITDDHIARVRLIGACRECHMSAMTLRAGEDAIRSSVPAIMKVEAVIT